MKIIKKGIEKRYFYETTHSLKGYVVEKDGDTFYITKSTAIFTYSGVLTIAEATWLGFGGLFLETLILINEGDSVTKGAIVDIKGVEQDKIEIVKYL